jgi:uncharacterized protein YjbJ (UPF0337 family)
MNWDIVKGNWNQAMGEIKKTWGKLTDDDVTYIAGERDKMLGKLQERYGWTRNEAESRLDNWMAEARWEWDKRT